MIQDTTNVQDLNRQIALDSIKSLMESAGFSGPYDCNGFDGWTNNGRGDPNRIPDGPHIRLGYTVIFIQVMQNSKVSFHYYPDLPWAADIYEGYDVAGVSPLFGDGIESLFPVVSGIRVKSAAPIEQSKIPEIIQVLTEE